MYFKKFFKANVITTFFSLFRSILIVHCRIYLRFHANICVRWAIIDVRVSVHYCTRLDIIDSHVFDNGAINCSAHLIIDLPLLLLAIPEEADYLGS